MSIYSTLIDLDTLKDINKFICETSDTPEEHSNVINEANLLSALSVLDSYFETPEETAAALLRSLTIAHGFEQGNKRTAFIASMMVCPCSCSHKEAADITLKIATGELKDVKMIAKKLFKLNEDLFVDVPEVEYQLDTNIDLEGPEPGEDLGVSGLLLDLIGDIAKNINNYNQMQANLENYPEIAELIKDFADDENAKLGKVQSALKTISPNAEYIMSGAVEAEEEMDPGSPLDESLKEDTNFVNKDVLNLLNDYFRHHLGGNEEWADVDSVEVVGKDTYKVEVHFSGVNSYSTVDSDGYRYIEYEDTDEYKTYVVKVNGNYVSIISNESLKESNES